MFRTYFGLCLATSSAEKAYWVTIKKSLKVTMEEAPIQVLTKQLHKIYPIILYKNYQNVSVGSQFSHNDFKMSAPLPFLSIEALVKVFWVHIWMPHLCIALTAVLAVFFGS